MAEGTQRRLAAIVSADVVGYSRLMGVDEAGTLATMRAHREELWNPIIERFSGRVVGTAGDAILVEYASAVAAVESSIAVQQGMAERNADLPDDERMLLRIGINIGEVIVEDDDIYGDGVNVAARLQEIAEPGGVAVSGNVHEQITGKLDGTFADDGLHDVKNISRQVQVWRWSPMAIAQETAVSNYADHDALPLPDKPSIAVLPFDNLSGDPEQEYFADGMTEDVITELSRFENLFVIARNTTFTYKGQRVDVKEVARDLGVHYILEGSVRKAGNRVRVTAQLINGQDGSHVWAERYDGGLEDIFDLQAEVTTQVVGSIAPHIDLAEMQRAERGERVFDDAHELAWKAQALFRLGLSQGNPNLWLESIGTAEAALKKNAKCGPAYVSICLVYAMQNLLRWGNDPSASARLAEEWAKKFSQELPASYLAYFCLGVARWRTGRYQDGIRDLRYARDLNPNDSTVLRFLAVVEAASGEFEQAKVNANLAIRLSPRDSYIHPAYLALAMAAFIEQDSSAFEEAAGKAIQLAPHAPIRRAMMIAYAAEVGNEALLETHRQELMRSAPDFVESLFAGQNELFERPEHMKLLLDGLRKAGFPG